MHASGAFIGRNSLEEPWVAGRQNTHNRYGESMDMILAAGLALGAKGGLPRPGATYRHYKGGLYTVLMLADHCGAGWTGVVYKSIETGLTWIRPLHGNVSEKSGWMDPVADGRSRFEEVKSGAVS